MTEGDYLEGPLELIVEIAASSVSYDLHSKKKTLTGSMACASMVWRTEDQALDWWELLEGIGPREMMVGDHSGLNRYYF